MKRILATVFSLTLAAVLCSGVQPGDPYQAVIAERGQPVSKLERGSARVLRYADAEIRLEDDVVVSVIPIKAEAVSGKQGAAGSAKAKPTPQKPKTKPKKPAAKKPPAPR